MKFYLFSAASIILVLLVFYLPTSRSPVGLITHAINWIHDDHDASSLAAPVHETVSAHIPADGSPNKAEQLAAPPHETTLTHLPPEYSSTKLVQSADAHVTAAVTHSTKVDESVSANHTATPNDSHSHPHSHSAATTDGNDASDEDDSKFDLDKGFFQNDLPWFELPQFDLAKLKALAPHNYNGSGHPTYATYYASRESSMADPYFLAAQQIVYRLLWDPRSKSNHYPVTVFVAPFVSNEQRDYFAAAGAIVRELPLVPFVPNNATADGISGRLMDMFSKLEMWNQTEFSRIAYLDSDAFPLANIDALFPLAKEQVCKKDLLRKEDRTHASELCDYVFTGHWEDELTINAGVMVFKPNVAMHALLLEETHRSTDFDNGYVEQALLNHVFRPDGPFPPSTPGLSEAWNGFPNTPSKGGALYILHAKIWAMFFEQPRDWTTNLFNDTWWKMIDLYESDKFDTLRTKDDVKLSKILP